MDDTANKRCVSVAHRKLPKARVRRQKQIAALVRAKAIRLRDARDRATASIANGKHANIDREKSTFTPLFVEAAAGSKA